MRGITDRAGSTALGLLADRLLGEPPAGMHPVAAFGTLMGRIESHRWRDTRLAGVEYAVSGLAIALTAGSLVRSTGIAVGVSAAGRELRRTATRIADLLEADDLEGAKAELPALVGRDPSTLDRSGVAAAVIESLAENTVDAVVSTAVWGTVAGARGALAHRAVNTMDAMVGHRSDRYARFGTAAARLDDAANWIPARLFVLLVAAVRPSRARVIATTVRWQAPAHPSPNAGVAEAAVAAALGVELGGPLRYGDREELRPHLGTGPRPGTAEVRAAIALVDRAELTLVAVLGSLFAIGRIRRRCR